MNRPRWRRMVSGAAMALSGTSLLRLSACDGQLGVDFRNAAGDNIRQGVQSIVTGLVDGAFAVFDPNPQSGSGN